MPGAETARAVLNDREHDPVPSPMSPALASKFCHMINSGQGCGGVTVALVVLADGFNARLAKRPKITIAARRRSSDQLRHEGVHR